MTTAILKYQFPNSTINYFPFIELIREALVNKISWVSGVHVHNSSEHCIVYSPSQSSLYPSPFICPLLSCTPILSN